MADKTKVATKVFQRMGADVFIRASEVLGLTYSDLTTQLGFRSNAFTAWIAQNSMPFSAGKLCETMVELHEMKAREKSEAMSVLVVLPKTQAQLDTATAFFKAVGIETLQTIL